MNDMAADPNAPLRRSIYWLLILASTGMMLGRILAVNSVDMAGLEANRLGKIPGELEKKRQSLLAQGVSGEALNRQLAAAESQWRQQAALQRPFLSANDRSRWATVRALVENDMRVEGAPYAIDKVIQQRNWDTIDMVKHDGHLYSSKPTLLPTLMAAAYWPIYQFSGATLGTHPHEIDWYMLVLLNIVPLLVGFALLARLIERFGTSDWGRGFVMAAAAFGTFLTTFAVTVNNHLPAAVCAIVAVYAAVRIWFDGERRLRYFVIAGLFAALAAANEFPAASIFAAVAVLLLWKSPRMWLLGFVPAVVVVAAAFFGTEWIAQHNLVPAYLHRSGNDNWYDYTYERNGRTIESYWKNPQGLDRGEPSREVYAFNILIGHHGIFSLTPVWLLSFLGMGVWMFRRGDARVRWSAAAMAAISLACIAFYLAQPLINRNYGGSASGFRWVFWLAPLWLLTMLPMADVLARRRWTRALALVLLALSVLSATYPTWNPWTHPWLMNLTQNLHWGIL
jgi:hypothetical protein